MNIQDQWKIIEALRNKLKNDPVLLDKFKEYEVDPEEFLYYPICFKNLDVSGRTEHACIYLNNKFLEKFDNIEEIVDELAEYVLHETIHVLQQSTGDGPTQGSVNDQEYLQNPAEIEGFQSQIEYISKEDGKDKAEEYVEQVLEHNGFPEEKKSKKKKQLLKDASKQLKLNLDLPKEKLDRKEEIAKFKKLLEDVDQNQGKFIPRPSLPLRNINQYRRDQLSKLWNSITESVKNASIENENAFLQMHNNLLKLLDYIYSFLDKFTDKTFNMKDIIHNNMIIIYGQINIIRSKLKHLMQENKFNNIYVNEFFKDAKSFFEIFKFNIENSKQELDKMIQVANNIPYKSFSKKAKDNVNFLTKNLKILENLFEELKNMFIIYEEIIENEGKAPEQDLRSTEVTLEDYYAL